MMAELFHDLRLGFRSLLRAPSVLLGGSLCLALGLGVNATLLGVLDVLLLRPPEHVRDAGSVVRVYFRERAEQAPQSETAYPVYADLAGRVSGLSGLAAYARTETSLGRGAEARKVRAAVVTPSFFPLLGVQPVRGRLFSEEEGDPAQPGSVVLLGWEFWRRAFGGAPGVLGRALPIGPHTYTVAGVLPPRFTGIDLDPIDVWLPIGAAGPLQAGAGWSEDRGHSFLSLVGRLRPGVSREPAAQQATAVHRQVYSSLRYRGVAEREVSLGPVQVGRSVWGAPAARLAAWLAGTSGAVLLIACFNVANLLIVRGLERRRELAVRLALGASRLRLARLLFAESLALALLGGAAAWLAMRPAGDLVRAYLLPQGAPPTSPLDPRLLGVLLALTLGAGVLCGLVPALRASRRDLTEEIKRGAQPGASGRSRLRAAFLVTQVALTFLLLLGAGLFLSSLRNIRHQDLGLDVDRLLVATVDLAKADHEPREFDALYRHAAERIRHLPGVERASVAAGIPFRTSFGADISLPGRGDAVGLAPGGIYQNAVAEDYFATMGIALRRGRLLSAADGAGAGRVAVVNETMARLLWPGQSPLGRCFQVGGETEPCTTVVGVVKDARRSGLTEPATMQFYLPLAQAPESMASRALFVRAHGAPEDLAGAVQREVQGIAPGLPFVDVRALSELLDPRVRPWRTGATLFTLFGLLALALAVVGIFAAIAQAVASRHRELGVRMALGAREGTLLWQLVRFGCGLAALGTVLGLGLAALAGRHLEPLLFEVSATDPRVTAAAVLTVLLAALLASYLPGLRVRRIDPAAAMRAE